MKTTTTESSQVKREQGPPCTLSSEPRILNSQLPTSTCCPLIYWPYSFECLKLSVRLLEFVDTISNETLSNFLCWYMYQEYLQPQRPWLNEDCHIDKQVLANWIAIGYGLRVNRLAHLPYKISQICAAIRLSPIYFQYVLVRLSEPKQMRFTHCGGLRQNPIIRPRILWAKVSGDLYLLVHGIKLTPGPSYVEVIPMIQRRLELFLKVIILPEITYISRPEPELVSHTSLTAEQIRQVWEHWVEHGLERTVVMEPYDLAAELLLEGTTDSTRAPAVPPPQASRTPQAMANLIEQQNEELHSRI